MRTTLYNCGVLIFPESSMNHIELFSGCGGLSLGLHASDFELLMANELSPMAAESFAYNFFNEDLEALANAGKTSENTIWLNSRHQELKPRLRENPFNFPPFDEDGHSDMPINKKKLRGKLLVGSIVELNRMLESDSEFCEVLRSGFGSSDGLDLVSGGPPCQSFSMAGLRKKDCEKNTLPWEFAKFVSYSQPKIAMLENVTGILRAFKDESGNSYQAWYEVAKAFASIGYVPLCLHINARLAGIAQNRPRFIMLALRYDCYLSIINNMNKNSSSFTILEPSGRFYDLVQSKGTNLEAGHLEYFDASKPKHMQLFGQSFLAPLVNGETVSVKDALDDLKFTNSTTPSKYINKLNEKFRWLPSNFELKNHEARRNSPVVQRRFRLYQVLQKIDDRTVTKDIFSVLKGGANVLNDKTWTVCKDYKFLQENGELNYFESAIDFIRYLSAHPTKKQTQKALNPDAPAPAALSIPDDACHYDEHELRVLTVREMARIQSFPDNFVFRSKITTGGQMRKFEVPQYTQVGNAVPPLLALKLGLCITDLISRIPKPTTFN